jgi:hypothetical protein
MLPYQYVPFLKFQRVQHKALSQVQSLWSHTKCNSSISVIVSQWQWQEVVWLQGEPYHKLPYQYVTFLKFQRVQHKALSQVQSLWSHTKCNSFISVSESLLHKTLWWELGLWRKSGSWQCTELRWISLINNLQTLFSNKSSKIISIHFQMITQINKVMVPRKN